MKLRLRSILFDHFSYKLISLLIALVLWLTILGRRDFQVSRSVQLDLVTAENLVVEGVSHSEVKVRVSGPRPALKKFLEHEMEQIVTLNLRKLKPGTYQVTIPEDQIDLPFGVRLVNVKPKMIRVSISRKGP